MPLFWCHARNGDHVPQNMHISHPEPSPPADIIVYDNRTLGGIY